MARDYFSPIMLCHSIFCPINTGTNIVAPHCILIAIPQDRDRPLPAYSLLDWTAMKCCLVVCMALVIAFTGPAVSGFAQECETWPRVLPPEGLEIPSSKLDKWKLRISALDAQLAQHPNAAYWPDVEVLVKACRLAIEFREFYQEKDFDKCDNLLTLAEKRVAWLTAASGKPGPLKDPEAKERLQVRGYKSIVDGSAQPVGLIMPEKGIEGSQKIPMFVWLHGRGDKSTDLHFLNERLRSKGEVVPPEALVLHAFGRQCVGYKSAGTTDVLEAIDFVCDNYPIDRNKIVLIGFSMGGAGVWHVAARNADRFVAASPGAGFAETRRYQNLTPDKYPAKYVQTLWAFTMCPITLAICSICRSLPTAAKMTNRFKPRG